MAYTSDAYATMLLTMALSADREEYARPYSVQELRKLEATVRDTAIRRIGGSAAAYTETDGGAAVPAWGDMTVPVGGTVSSSMICGVHYELGDLCDIADEGTGIVLSERVTEITYIYEGGHVRAEPRFGEAYPDFRTFIGKYVADRTTLHC